MLGKGGAIRKRSMNLVIAAPIPLIDFVVFKIAFSWTVKGSLQSTKFLVKLVFQILVVPVCSGYQHSIAQKGFGQFLNLVYDTLMCS